VAALSKPERELLDRRDFPAKSGGRHARFGMSPQPLAKHFGIEIFGAGDPLTLAVLHYLSKV
jgi:hypothetical protein